MTKDMNITIGRFEATGKRVFTTTVGWDGKDYEGKGRSFPAWRLIASSPLKYADDMSKTVYIRIYDRSHRCYCFLEVTDRLSDAGIPVAEYAYAIY